MAETYVDINDRSDSKDSAVAAEAHQSSSSSPVQREFRANETLNLLMETTSKPKVTIPLVAAISIPYTTIPINLFHGGKIDTSAKTNIKSNRAQPYTAAANSSSNAKQQQQRCSNCHKHSETLTSSAVAAASSSTSLVAAISTAAATNNTTTNSEQTAAANIKLSTMFNGSPSAMLIVPFMQASNLSSQRQQKMLPAIYCSAGQSKQLLTTLQKDLSRVSERSWKSLHQCDLIQSTWIRFTTLSCRVWVWHFKVLSQKKYFSVIFFLIFYAVYSSRLCDRKCLLMYDDLPLSTFMYEYKPASARWQGWWRFVKISRYNSFHPSALFLSHTIIIICPQPNRKPKSKSTVRIPSRQ